MTDWKERAERAEAELARLRTVEPVMANREDFEAWWEIFQAEHDEWQFADREAILFAAWQAALAAPPAQPAEPVQRLSDERAAFEAWHNEYRTQELVRRDDTYYNTHVRCRWEGWQARAIESALQPGWRDIETPPGWKLVPICLTPEMREVLLMADRFTVGEVYIMLLAAAPKATK